MKKRGLFNMKTILIDRPTLYNEMREITGQTTPPATPLNILLLKTLMIQVEPYQSHNNTLE